MSPTVRRSPTPLEVALLIVTVVAGVAAAWFGLRYGDVRPIGEGTYRRDTAVDVHLIVLPAAVAVLSLVVLALSRLTAAGLREQWRRERAQQRQARAWSRRSGR